MNKFITVDIKKQKRKYRLKATAFLIPFVQFNLVIILLYYVDKSFFNTTLSNTKLLYYIIGSFSVIISIIIMYIVISHHLICAHKKNTFVEICSNSLIISYHKQTVIQHLKKIYYKQLYVVKLTELERVSFSKGKLIVKGKIRCFFDKADRLHYYNSENGIKFDLWWYDYNESKILDTIEIIDCFYNTSRLLKMIKYASYSENVKLKKRQEYHKQMIALACNTQRRSKRLRTEMFKNKR